MRVPRSAIHPAFKSAIRNSGSTLVYLSAISGFSAHTQLSGILNAKTIPLTALTLSRLRDLARVLAFEGELIEPPTSVADRRLIAERGLLPDCPTVSA